MTTTPDNNNNNNNNENQTPGTSAPNTNTNSDQTQRGFRGRVSKKFAKGKQSNDVGKSLWSGYKGGTPEFGAVLGTRSENGPKDNFNNFLRKGELWSSTGGIKDGWRDVVCIFRKLQHPSIGAPPADLDDTVKEGTVKRLLHEAKVERYFKREELLETNVPTICNVVWGQFSPALRENLKGLNEFEDRYEKYDVVWILEQAKLIASGVDVNTSNPYATVHRMLKNLYGYQQGSRESCEGYSKDLNEVIKTVELAGGNPLYHPTLHREEVMTLVKARGGSKYSEATTEEMIKGKATSQEKYRAIMLLEQADPGRYKELWTKLRTDATLGSDNYPTTWARSYDVINKYTNLNSQYKRKPFQPVNGGAPMQSGRSFAQSGTTRGSDTRTLVPGIDGRTFADKTCFGCGKPGHIRPLCPTDDSSRPAGRSGHMHTQIGVSLTQAAAMNGRTDIVNPDWLLLDSCSTITCLKNRALVVNPRKCTDEEQLRLHSNGGDLDYNEIAETLFLPMPGYVSDNNIANVYALMDVADRYRVTMDSASERAMLVHLEDGTIMKFRECGDGLYYFDTSRDNLIKPTEAYSFLNTVAANKDNFHRAEIEGADQARILQQQLGWPSKQHFIDIVTSNQLINCTITADDINRAEAIYGPALPILKGKMVRKRVEHIHQHPRITIPNELVEAYKSVDICIDYFFVNGKPYLHTISKRLNFRTSEATKGRGKKELMKLITAIALIYYRRGFRLDRYHADNEFKKIEDFILPAILYLCAAGQHVPEVERSIRTVKERVRCICAAMPYIKVPKLMMDNIVASATEWLNAFATNNGVSTTLSPNNIVLGEPKPDCKSLKLRIGSYVELQIGTTNTPKERSVGAITLRQNKKRGGYYFMSLETGRELHGHIYKELPITQAVIDRVEEMAEAEGQPSMRHGPIFEWSPGTLITDEHDDMNALEEAAAGLIDYNSEDDSDYEDEDTSDDEDNDNIDDIHMEDADHNDHGQIVTDDDNASSDEDTESDNNDDANGDEYRVPGYGHNNLNDLVQERLNDDPEHDISFSEHEHVVRDESDEDNSQLLSSSEDELSVDSSDAESEERDVDSIHAETEERPDTHAQSEERTTRPRRSAAGAGISRLDPSFTGKSYSNKDGVQMLSISNRKLKKWEKDCFEIAVNTTFKCFTQMHASKGFKTYGERAVAAMFKEYKQLIDMKVFGRVNPDKLTVEQKRRALRAIDLIKEKRTGLIKGRTVADGSQQRGYVSKEESASPTSTLDGFLMSLMIDAHENRCVNIFDVPSAFIQTDMPDNKEVIIRMVGKFVDIMCEVNPEFTADVRYENGQKVLYLKCLKAIYGLIEAALLWYQLYSTTLKDMGFTLNPYDKCVANKMIDGHQCTIVFYVDDNKVSHKDEKVVKAIIDEIESRFHGKLTRSEGKKHTFIGMDIEFIGDGKVSIATPQHLQEMIDDFPEDIKGSVVNPAKSKLFQVSHNSTKLDEEKIGIFRSITMKALWVSQRSRPDLGTAISFLTTRQNGPTMEDWIKLKRMLCFIKGTITDKRIIGADGLLTMGTYIDAAHAIHDDMRGQTGGAISFGWGILHGGSSRQKLNTKSSTETELVGVSDYVPRKIWVINFLREQGYHLNKKVLYQDNESTMKMLKNGRDSTTSRSRHVSIRFFFVADRIKKQEFSVEYCHTHSMLADFYSKALQGKLFHKYRDVLMGWKHVNTLQQDGVDLPAKERVENNVSEKYTTGNKTEKMTYAEIVKSNRNEKLNEERRELIQLR